MRPVFRSDNVQLVKKFYYSFCKFDVSAPMLCVFLLYDKFSLVLRMLFFINSSHNSWKICHTLFLLLANCLFYLKVLISTLLLRLMIKAI